MDASCPECDRLKQASDDAIRVETIMLAQKFLAASNGYHARLAGMVLVLQEASDLRRQARQALSCHRATHGNGQQSMAGQERKAAGVEGAECCTCSQPGRGTEGRSGK